MVGPPRFHGELGAKRVEVTARQEGQFGSVRVSLKTWPATTRKVHSSMDESLSANFAEPALLQGRAAGVGQPFTIGIANFELRI
jgi:hypothetical protein